MIERLLSHNKTLGVIFIVLVLLSVWLVYGVFTQKFAEYEEVEMRASAVGLQLPVRADIKIRGVIVGEVLEMKSVGPDEAVLTLGLYPDEIDQVPENVAGAILPKTLFGEKYVSLQIPAGTPADTPAVQAGDTIGRAELATELEAVLKDLHPLLRAVEPADLNLTLSALATALDGRGAALGENLERLDSYLKRINPQIPALLDDLRLTAEVADIYADILPEVATILDNTVTTLQTLEGREAPLNQLLKDVKTFSEFTGRFLDENADVIEELGTLSAKQFRLLAKYSPMFPCFTEGLVGAIARNTEAFRGHELHIILDFLPNQPRRYDTGDLPVIGEDRGPDCVTLPNPPFNRDPNNRNWRTQVPNFDDGVDRPTGKGTRRVAPGFGADAAWYDGTREDDDVLRAILGEYYGAGTATDLGVMLAAPLAAGGER